VKEGLSLAVQAVVQRRPGSEVSFSRLRFASFAGMPANAQ
jgi:hypothetical protein